MKYLSLLMLALVASVASAETTVYGKVVGIESRKWGLHVQTDFPAGSSVGCPVKVGDTYMYDFRYDNSMNSSTDAAAEVAILLSAFTAQKFVSFHIYGCSGDNRPLVGYIRIKN